MTRVTTMAFAAAVMSLSTGSVLVGDMVEFNYTWTGNAPIGDVESWSMSHVSEVVYYEEGGWGLSSDQEVVVNLTIGDQEIPVVAAEWNTDYFDPTNFVLSMDLNDVPGYGPLSIEMGLSSKISGPMPWYGTGEIVWGPGMPFGDGVSQTGTWSAQIVPAPGAIALLGLGGLARRRRRD